MRVYHHKSEQVRRVVAHAISEPSKGDASDFLIFGNFFSGTSAPFFLSLSCTVVVPKKSLAGRQGSVMYSSDAFKSLSKQPQSMPAGWKPQSQPGPLG